MKNQKLESIIELASVLARQSDFQEILRIVTQKSAVLLNAEMVLIMMVNPSTRETVKTVFRQGDEPEHQTYQLLHTYLTGWVIENNSGLISEDLQNDGRFRPEISVATSVGPVICMPLRSEGVITGTLLLMNRKGGRIFNQDDMALLERFSAIASPFLRNIQKIQQYFVSTLPEESLIKKYEAYGLLGSSEKFISLLQSIEAASACDVRVLLEGQSGSGKELIARAIHKNSSRSDRKFIAIDCGAIPLELIESELFGHIKGAFTGAGETRKGLMEEADGGTLFMDEITNLSREIQAKLLRVLQENEIRPLGSNKTRKINIRIIAATSSPLRQHLETGQFREDLFYRLYVYPVEIPSLAERKSDIPVLAKHFLSKFSKDQNKKIEALSEELLEFLDVQPWTGNIRELENLMERLVTLAPKEIKILDTSMLPSEFRLGWEAEKQQQPSPGSTRPLRDEIAAYEKKVIENALRLSGWNQSRAARILHISEHAIRYKMKNLGIHRQN